MSRRNRRDLMMLIGVSVNIWTCNSARERINSGSWTYWRFMCVLQWIAVIWVLQFHAGSCVFTKGMKCLGKTGGMTELIIHLRSWLNIVWKRHESVGLWTTLFFFLMCWLFKFITVNATNVMKIEDVLVT